MIKRYLTTLLVMLMTSCFSMMAQNTVQYGYSDRTEQLKYWGTGKAETYNIAIKISNPCLKGLKITALNIPFKQGVTNISKCSAFLTKELKVKGGRAEADIATVEFTPDSTWITVKLPEAYVIGDEPLYAGYTFKVDKATTGSKNPVPVVSGTCESGFMVVTSRTYRSWTSLNENFQAFSPMMVVLEGEIGENSVQPISLTDVRVRAGQQGKTSAVIANTGLNEVKSIDYTYTVDGYQSEGHIDLSSSIATQPYAATATIEINLPDLKKQGSYEGKLSITRVNGAENTQKVPYTSNAVNVISFTPTHRAVMEEFTGTWCGWCPRGWVAMEMLKERHPDKFIALSYHVDDIMQTTNILPVVIQGYPSASIDRGTACDPYFGMTTDKNLGIEDLWKESCAVPAPADINVKATLSNDEKTVNVESEVIFAEEHKQHPYRLAYYITADGLTGTTGAWTQTNYYSGNMNAGEDFKMFAEGPSDIFIEFNDVVIASSDFKGVEGSIPANVSMNERTHHQFQFKIADMTSMLAKGLSLVQDVNRLNAIVLMINTKTGRVENAAKCHVEKSSASGLSQTETQDTVTEVARYGIDGRQVAPDHKGISLIRLSNGKVKKVISFK